MEKLETVDLLVEKVRKHIEEFGKDPETASISKEMYKKLSKIFEMSLMRTAPFTTVITGLREGLSIGDSYTELKPIMNLYFIVSNTQDSDVEFDLEKKKEGYTKKRIIEVSSDKGSAKLELTNSSTDIVGQVFEGIKAFVSREEHMPAKLEISPDDMQEVLLASGGRTGGYPDLKIGAPKLGSTFRMLDIDWEVCDTENIKIK